MYHAHAPSLAGPWTVSKASSSNYVQHDDSGVDGGAGRHAGASLLCDAFVKQSTKGGLPIPALSTLSTGSGGGGNRVSSSSRKVASEDMLSRPETTPGFRQPQIVFTRNEDGYFEPIAFYALFGTDENGMRSEQARSEQETTVFGAACAHN